MACAPPLPPPPPPRSRAARDVRAPSCPPLSFHLRHSHPTPSIPLSLPPLLQPTPLPLSINLPPPSTPPPPFYLSTWSTYSFYPLSVRSPTFTPAPSIHPSLPIISAVCVSIPLVLCHSLSTPHLVLRAHVCVCVRLQPALSVLPTSPWAWFFFPQCPSAALKHFLKRKKMLLKNQRWEVTKSKYLVIVLEYIFQVSVSFSGNF